MKLPNNMKYVNIRQPGGAEGLEIATRPLPTPQPHELLIRVIAAGVNRPDIAQRLGLYPPPDDASDILGLEVAGEVAAIGSDCSGYEPGQAVCALVHGGGYAEYVTVAAQVCLPIPTPLGFVEAAGLPETFFTVWHNVFQRGNLQPGETLLVHGGSSGIGTTAIQLASALGSSVLVTAGSDEKCDLCKNLGAELAINYKTEDFVEKTLNFTDGQGVNLILDMVGGDYISRDITAAAENGRIVFIAFMKGAKVEFNFMRMQTKGITLTGSRMRPQPLAVKAKIAAELKETAWPLLDKQRIQPVIDSVFSFANVADAHARLESGVAMGKVILQVTDD